MKNLSYYRVTINQITGDAPSDGFIDPKPANDYLSYDDSTGELTGFPTTLALGEAKARGNIRWGMVKEQLGYYVNCLGVFEIVITGGDINTAPTSVAFTVCYERPDAVQISDSLNPGTTLSGADAVKRYVENALIIDRTITADIINPDIDSRVETKGIQTVNLEIGALATSLTDTASYVTVTEIDYTDNTVGNYRSVI